jgi:hypothetical protein
VARKEDRQTPEKLLMEKGRQQRQQRGYLLSEVEHIYRPNELAGLGVMDLNRFGRALRQRWFWYRWTDDTKPWQGMVLPCDDEDRALFHASTQINLGHGEKALFWHDRWLDGTSPKEIAPNLFKLAHFKNRSVAKELVNRNWIKSVRHISTTQELSEYIKLEACERHQYA